MLDSAGWKRDAAGVRRRGSTRLAFGLLVPSTSASRKLLAEALQESWRRLGAEVSIDAVDFPVFQQRLAEGKFDVYIGAYLDEPSPYGIVDQWTRAGWGALNYGHYANPVVDSLIGVALAASELGIARTRWHEVLDSMNVDVPAVFLYTPEQSAVASRRITGVTIDPWSWLDGIERWGLEPLQAAQVSGLQVLATCPRGEPHSRLRLRLVACDLFDGCTQFELDGRPAGGNPMSSLWNRRSVAALLFLAGLAACDEPSPLPPPDGGGGGSTPLVIDSTKPAGNALVAPFGQPVFAFTDSAVQPSTLTVTSFSIVTDSVTPIDVPRQVSVQGGNRLQAVASLLPGTKYRATISTTLRSTNGGALPAPHTWTFTTRPIAHFPLASGTSFSASCPWPRTRPGGFTLSMPTR